MSGRAALAAAALAAVVVGCGGADLGAGLSTADDGGVLVVTAGGTVLRDGATDVPATLDLRVSAGDQLTPGSVAASLDGRPLAIRPDGRAVTASVPALPLSSAHRLDVVIGRRDPLRVGFHVVAPAAAYAALHQDPAGAGVLDVVFSLAIDRRGVEAALPGGEPRWIDDRHLEVRWPTAPGGILRLAPTIPAQRGSHLAAPLALGLGPVAAGSVRSTLVPPAPAPAGRPLVVGFTVATAASRSALATHAAQLSAVSPTGLLAEADGALAGSPDPGAAAIAADHGVPLWPLLQNRGFDTAGAHRLLTDRAAEQGLVAAVGSRAERDGWAGLHLDIEEVSPDDRDALTRLVRDLAATLHAGHRKLAVAIVPHKPGRLNVHSGAYDLGAIGSVADLVTVMAYPQHTAGSAGAVAGVDWDIELLDGTLAPLGHPARALLGIPVYDLSWGPGEAAAADGYEHALAAAMGVADARLDHDFEAGVTLVRSDAGGGATTYLEDADSLVAKLALVAPRGMAGIALWRLGFEDPAIWAHLPARAERPA